MKSGAHAILTLNSAQLLRSSFFFLCILTAVSRKMPPPPPQIRLHPNLQNFCVCYHALQKKKKTLKMESRLRTLRRGEQPG